jgi:hypothetical protein
MVRIAIQTQYEQDHYRLPHQWLWFVLIVIALMLLLTKNVAALSASLHIAGC